MEQVSRGKERESERQMSKGERNKMSRFNDEERGERVEKPKDFMSRDYRTIFPFILDSYDKEL